MYAIKCLNFHWWSCWGCDYVDTYAQSEILLMCITSGLRKISLCKHLFLDALFTGEARITI